MLPLNVPRPRPTTPLRFLLALAFPLALAACVRSPRLDLARAPDAPAVQPLQLFGAAPDLMPGLSFEPVEGVLTVSAARPVFLTVLEVDPATQARTVVFPEPGAKPLRVSGEVALQLSLLRGDDPLPSRGLLVIASRDSLVVAGDSSGTSRATTSGAGATARDRGDAATPASGDRSSWAIPAEMPEQWAAVYLWAPTRHRTSGGGR